MTSDRADHCSCVKPPGIYGAHGWHWRPNPAYPDARQEDQATERCGAYRAAIERDVLARGAERTAERERQKRGGRRY